MRELFVYYFLSAIFYFAEIILFSLVYKDWYYDIFWLNILLKTISLIMFALTSRWIIFYKAQHFYKKFFAIQAILNPIFASVLLKMLILLTPTNNVVIIKFISDLFTSIVFFKVLKKAI